LEKESEVYDNIYATIACHSAFRTGDFITVPQAEDLLKEMKIYDVFSCPHGRPVKYKLPFSQLDTFFKRS
jgi:DNA mismatch repair protein MutL